MAKGCVFILSVSSDIGHALALEYLNDGYEVIGTYRKRELVADLAQEDGMQLLYCDIASRESIKRMIIAYGAISKIGIPKPWDIFISCVGTLEPIGPFFSSDFDVWEQAVTVNSLAQLRVLREIWSYKRHGQLCHAAFFAGGGTNNPLPNYSAYASSKVFLIKMCELLDDECPELNIFIIGPGFRRTKIHRQTFKSSVDTGRHLEHTRELFRSSQNDDSHKDIYYFINWCIGQGKNIVSGRNFSVLDDCRNNSNRHELAEQLRKDREKFKLRRFRNREE